MANALDQIVADAAAAADKQFEGAEHVADAQIDAAAGAAARKVTALAQAAMIEGLEASIRAKMRTKARAPKPEAVKA
jgi:hypothetical protein